MMEAKTKYKVYLIDHDNTYLERLREAVGSVKYKISELAISSFVSLKPVLEAIDEKPDIIIMDYNSDLFKANNIEADSFLENLKAMAPGVKIILLNGIAGLKNVKDKIVDYTVGSKTDFLSVNNKITEAINNIKDESLNKFGYVFLKKILWVLIAIIIIAIVLHVLWPGTEAYFFVGLIVVGLLKRAINFYFEMTNKRKKSKAAEYFECL